MVSAPPTRASVLVRDQDRLLRATLDLLDGRADALDPTRLGGLVTDQARLRTAGFASGLTAALAALAARRSVTPAAGWAAYLADQSAAVAARQARFEAVLPDVLRALDGAGVGALPVKGAVLAGEVWPLPGCRPMSDLDLIIDPAQRAKAAVAMAEAGFELIETSAWEDTFLAWGDGSVGRTDGESPGHNGKIELHPGWVERLHNYLIDDGGLLLRSARPGTLAGAPCLRLEPALFAVQVVGHLSATVIRAETRAVHVVDAVLCLRQLEATGQWDRFVELAGSLDARLVVPGLWLVQRYRPESIGPRNEALFERLGPAAARRLAAADATAVLRDPNRRTSVRWRHAFTSRAGERLAMARQVLAPPAVDRRGAGTPSSAGWQRHPRRVARLARRAR